MLGLSASRSEQFSESQALGKLSCEEQIMSKDKYPSIFSAQMETIMFIVLQIFYARCAVLKIGVYSRISPSFSWRIFGHVTHLDQLWASEKIWWIIIYDICKSKVNAKTIIRKKYSVYTVYTVCMVCSLCGLCFGVTGPFLSLISDCRTFGLIETQWWSCKNGIRHLQRIFGIA